MRDLPPLAAAYQAALTGEDITRAADLEAQLDAADAAREARLNAPGALRDAALWYATQGVAVFPCAPGAKRPITRHGLHDATTDIDAVAAWWATTPDANIGMPTGHLFDVVDIDAPAGLIAVYELIDLGEFPPVRAVARTPRGRHLYIDPTPGRTNRTGLMPHVDFRATGGYVVAPPSRTADGTYRWLDGHDITRLLEVRP